MSESLTLRSARAIRQSWTHGVKHAGRNVGKVVVTCVSTSAALIAILVHARNYGLLGGPQKGHLAIGGFSAVWVGVAPAVDTAFAIGDTIQLVATAKDSHGSTLVGAPIVWTSDDANIVTVDGDGSVVARGAGATTVVVAVGERVARARIHVRPRAVAVRFRAGGVADQGLARVGEGTRVRLEAYGVDSRGHTLAARAVSWQSSDTTVVRVDSSGIAVGVAMGSAAVVATVDGVSERLSVDVMPVPATIQVASGGEQHAAAGARLAQPIIVRVLSTRGKPVAGADVRFLTPDGGAAEPAVAVTDADGRARARWTLGDAPGRQRIAAAVEPLDSVAFAFAEAEPVAANVRAEVLGGGQEARAGETLPLPVRVRLTDSLGRALVGVPVTWAAADGGVATSEVMRTDSAGEAQARWKLGARAGTQKLRALVGGTRAPVPAAVVVARARSGPPGTIAVTAGDAQRAPAGSALVWPVVLRVLDRAGNPAAGATVTLMPSAGTVADSTVEADSLGFARVWWTLGRAAGTQRLAARVENVRSPATVVATARPRAAANLEITGVPDSAPAGRALAKPVVATVTDAYGNPVADARVRFTAASGAVSPRTIMTDERGRAVTHWTLGSTVGEQSLAAEVNAESRSAARVQAVAAKAVATKAVATKSKPTAKVATKPPAQPAVKPVVKPVASSAKPATRPATKPVAKSATKPAAKATSAKPAAATTTTSTPRTRTASRG